MRLGGFDLHKIYVVLSSLNHLYTSGCGQLANTISQLGIDSPHAPVVPYYWQSSIFFFLNVPMVCCLYGHAGLTREFSFLLRNRLIPKGLKKKKSPVHSESEQARRRREKKNPRHRHGERLRRREPARLARAEELDTDGYFSPPAGSCAHGFRPGHTDRKAKPNRRPGRRWHHGRQCGQHQDWLDHGPGVEWQWPRRHLLPFVFCPGPSLNFFYFNFIQFLSSSWFLHIVTLSAAGACAWSLC